MRIVSSSSIWEFNLQCNSGEVPGVNEVDGAGNFVVGFELHGRENKKFTEQFCAREAPIIREGRAEEGVQISWQH